MKRNEKIQKLIDANKVYGDFDVDENLKKLYEKEYSDFNLHRVEYSFNKTGFSILINAFKNDDKQLLNFKEIKKDFKWHECNAAWIDYLMSDECIRLKTFEALGRKFEIFKTVGRKLDRAIAKVCYDQTQNPMFLMRIYQICREHKYKIPEYVFEYFDKYAHNLFELTNDGAGGSAVPKIARATGMRVKGRHNAFTQYAQVKRNAGIYNLVEKLKNDQGLKGENLLHEAEDKLKENGICLSYSQIKRIYHNEKLIVKSIQENEKEKPDAV